MTPGAIIAAFADLEAAGFPRPETYKTDDGMADAVRTWMLVLEDITPEELDVATFAWAQKSEPWWPKPGQLLDLVPYREESSCAYGCLMADMGTTILTGAIVAALGSVEEARVDRVRFEQLYRRMQREWASLSPDERHLTMSRLGQNRTSRVALLLPSAVTDALEGADLSPRLTGEDSQQRRRLLKVVEEHG